MLHSVIAKKNRRTRSQNVLQVLGAGQFIKKEDKGITAEQWQENKECHSPLITETSYCIKEANMNYRTVIIFILLSFLISLPTCAASIYEWMDENGVWHITDTPPPKRIKKFNEERYDKDSPEEINRYQRQQETRSVEAIQEANRRLNEETERQRENRNREADKLEAEARKNIPGSQGMTASQRNMLENAARIRVGGEPIPNTPP